MRSTLCLNYADVIARFARLLMSVKFFHYAEKIEPDESIDLLTKDFYGLQLTHMNYAD